MSSPPTVHRFAGFTLDRTAYRLLKDGAPVDLSPKALDLLLLFLTRPGALVTKDDMLKALWPDVAVTDNALTQVVSELRQALGDDPAAPRFIETVPRRGYRFIAAVDAEPAGPAAGVVPTGEQAPIRGSGDAGRRTIAVPDFTNVTGDPDVMWLAAGIAETVTNDLRAIRDLRVIDRSLLSAAAATAAGQPPPGVSLVVTGSYQRAGDRLRITASVIDTATHEAIAHAKADGALADVFALQDAVVTELSTGLQISVTPAASARIHARETSDLEAYRALTEGRLKLELLDPAAIPGAIEDFERALALDPEYALAHVGLAHARFWRFQGSRARNRPDAGELTGAIAHARKAIELDPDLAEAHSALAFFLASAERPAEAIAAGRRAVALEPGNWRHEFRLGMAAWGGERLASLDAVIAEFPRLAYAHFGLAMVHVARDDRPRAIEALLAGLASEATASAAAAARFPANGLHWLLGLMRLADGDTASAATEFDRELRSKGSGLFAAEFAMDAYDGHGFVRLKRGDPTGAVEMFEHALRRYPGHARSLVGLSLACRKLGQSSRADESLARAQRAIDELGAGGRATEAALAKAFLHTVADRRPAAVAVLDQLMTGAPAGPAGWTIPVEPLLDPLRKDPAFGAVLKRLAERAR
jgi:DNA-binding winged helix-turn-helix (wHTH) protein/tetratricopeptide (TPR) repeat protein